MFESSLFVGAGCLVSVPAQRLENGYRILGGKIRSRADGSLSGFERGGTSWIGVKYLPRRRERSDGDFWNG